MYDITTPFSDIYESFLSKITDDMYMEFTKEDTYKMLEDLLISAIPKFEFPRFDIFNYERGVQGEGINYIDAEGHIILNDQYEVGFFKSKLTMEEKNILATYMIVEWLGQQLASIENTRMKFSGTDFKLHLKLIICKSYLLLRKIMKEKGFIYKDYTREELLMKTAYLKLL